MIKVNLFGDDKLGRKFNAIQRKLNSERVLDESGAILLNRLRARFLEQKSPDGEEWDISLAARRREEENRGGGTLFDTGTLFHSIQLSRPGPGVREISTDVPYARTHDEGLGQNPVREFMGFSQEDERIVFALFERRIDEATK